MNSPHDAKPEVADPGGLDHPGSFQLDLPNAVMVEQSDSVAEEHGYEVNLYLVEKPRF
jgi:hypothetical protein